MPCETCFHERELDDIKNEIDRNRDDKRQIYNRLTSLERYSEKSKTDLEYIKNGIDGMTKKLELLQEKPGKRWEHVVTTVIAAVITSGVAGIIGFLLAMKP